MNTEKTYSIAGLRVRVAGGETARAIAQIAGFSVFETAGDRDADIDIFTDRDIDTGSLAEVRLLHNFSVLEIDHYFSTFADGYLFEMRRQDGAPVVSMTHDRRTNEVVMSSCDCEMSLKFATWVAYAFVAVGKGVLPIHASSIVKDGHAVLFLGESGTGKSTHTRLWLKHIADSYLLNDDSPLVRIDEKGIFACGSPWSGKVHCYHQRALPLKAMVRLRQGPENKIGRLNRLTSIGAVYPSCPPLFAYDELLSGKMLGTLDNMINMVPVYSLECLPDSAAAELAYSTIYLT